MLTQNKRLLGLLLTVVVVLLLPLVAMQFTTEVNWSTSDFVIAGVLLGGTGLACEGVLRMVKKPSYRWSLCAVVLLCLLVVWVELAVGVFGSPWAGQ
jgi:hypothetical protein